MADEGDLSQEAYDAFVAERIRAFLQSTSEQPHTAKNRRPRVCRSCGLSIPEARRKALPGCLYCRDCAEELFG